MYCVAIINKGITHSSYKKYIRLFILSKELESLEVFERQRQGEDWQTHNVFFSWPHHDVIFKTLRNSTGGPLWALSLTPTVILYLPTTTLDWPLPDCPYLTWASTYIFSYRPHFCSTTCLLLLSFCCLYRCVLQSHCLHSWHIRPSGVNIQHLDQKCPSSADSKWVFFHHYNGVLT